MSYARTRLESFLLPYGKRLKFRKYCNLSPKKGTKLEVYTALYACTIVPFQSRLEWIPQQSPIVRFPCLAGI